jgi:hypothetical protein
MTFESSIGKFKQTQSLLFTAVLRTKNLNLKSQFSSYNVKVRKWKLSKKNTSLAFKLFRVIVQSWTQCQDLFKWTDELAKFEFYVIKLITNFFN